MPDDAGKIDASAIMRTGVLQSLGVKQFTERYMSGLEILTKKLARAFLSRFDPKPSTLPPNPAPCTLHSALATLKLKP